MGRGIPPRSPLQKNNLNLLAGVSISNSELFFEKRGADMPKMTKTKYKNLIIRQLTALGTLEESYSGAIETLAEILVQRDKTREEFEESGGKSAVEYTNKGGATNMTKNPLLTTWDELNKTALSYWRELGLTPSSYKKLAGEGARKEKGRKGLADVLKELSV